MKFHKQLENLFLKYKESKLFGRYITNNNIEPLINNLPKSFKIDTIGHSVQKLPIYAIKIGSGSKKILMWSQMHGNESTTTKALFDLFNTISANELEDVIKKCELCIIPILNPDGAKAYTRLNANSIDLNRDAQDLSQPESQALRSVFEDFKPNYCFNLHGQRTIFSAGNQNKPATVSFLAPAQDSASIVTATRKMAMEIIVEMEAMLQHIIPNQIGIYDDAFNLNCVGDMFQSRNIPTVLFEAGHFEDDFNREEVRKFIYMALSKAINHIATTSVKGENHEQYAIIPKNKKLFYDVIIRNAQNANGEILDFAIQYEELLLEDKVLFLPKIEKIGALDNYYGHRELNANSYLITDENGEPIYEGYANDFVIINNEKLSLKLKNN